jgi:4-diphosphocytidyl-2-C-methyl-D-erythritol kinase
MRFESAPNGKLTLDCPQLAFPPAQNLVIQAAMALQAYTGINHGAHISLEKNLPMGGGLGGGSSNAATTLLALNNLWKTGLDLPTLATIGRGLGADVPVFVFGRSAWAEGIGDILEPVHCDPAWFVVLRPPCEVPTREIFSDEELTRTTTPIKIAAVFKQGGKNDCEPVVRRLYPGVEKALTWLERYAPSRLTGTGACVFARFDALDEAQAVLNRKPKDFDGFIARGINQAPAHKILGLAEAS